MEKHPRGSFWSQPAEHTAVQSVIISVSGFDVHHCVLPLPQKPEHHEIAP